MKLAKRQFLVSFAVALMMTTIATFWHGYSFGKADQVLQLPLIYRLLDTKLYPGDQLFPTITSNITPIYQLVIWWIKSFHFQVETVFIGGFFTATFFFYLGAYWVGRQLSQSKTAVLLGMLLLCIPYPVGGSAIDTVEILLIPRFAAEVTLLWLAIGMIKGRPGLVFGLFCLVLLIHPLTAGIAFIYIVTIYGTRLGKRRLWRLPWIIAPYLFVIAVYSVTRNYSFDLPQTVIAPTEWLAVLRLRNFYAFPLHWSLRSWFYLGMALIPLGWQLLSAWFGKRQLTTIDKTIILITLTSFAVFAFQIIFTEVIPITWVIPLQLGRVWWLPVIISVLFAGTWLDKWREKFRLPAWWGVGIGVAILLLLAYFKRQPLSIQQTSTWIQTQTWAQTHTENSCTFLVDFYSQGFRVYSRRPIVGEYKDGTLSFYSASFARIWEEKRSRFTGKTGQWYIDNLSQLQSHYSFSFVVVEKPVVTGKIPVYSNSDYAIYQTDKPESNCRLLN